MKAICMVGDYNDTVVAGDPLSSYNGATRLAGVVMPAGTRSVLFFGTQGIGEFCYGTGANRIFVIGSGERYGWESYPLVHVYHPE